MAGLEISAVIPAYNEQDAIAPVVKKLTEALSRSAARFEIIVVDDGSTDKTYDNAIASGVVALRHPTNRGYGRSLMTAFSRAKYDWILMIDADGSYPPEEAEKLFAHAPASDLIIGARQGDTFWGTPLQAWRRRVYLRLASFVAGEPIPDANSGLRLLRKSAFDRSMPFLCLGYSFTTTMTLSFLSAGRFVAYVPVRFVERTGRSKVKPVRDILRTLQIMMQMMIYYNPLKLAAVVVAALLGTALAAFVLLWACVDLGAALAAAFALFSLSVVVFLLGCVLDAIRLHFAAARGPVTLD
ncbi:MAG TPA: glycosyltransferase family 2 protein [Elusimicrobiota bacterium]|nr:glycosyltransferase family 2 protein [Elusimicrobiota bacterium]